jgi:hypothetical protein
MSIRVVVGGLKGRDDEEDEEDEEDEMGSWSPF